MLAPLSSTVYFPALPTITEDLRASGTAVNATVSLFILFMGIAPVLWASISDHYGVRRVLYLSSIAIFIIASIGSAFVNDITLLIILRCIQSCGSSSSSSLGAGTIADCYDLHERGTAMGLLFLGQYLGPLIGPTIGGFLTSAFGWRATFWFCAILAIFILLVMFFALPETYRHDGQWATSAVISDEPKEEGDGTVVIEDNVDETKTPEHSVKAVSSSNSPKRMNPIASLGLLKHLFILVIAIETGISFGAMFTTETVLPGLFASAYNLDSSQTGLTYLGAGCGNIVGSFVGGMLSDYFLKKARIARGGHNIPEDRLGLNAWVSGIIFIPGGILMFGWSVYYKVSLAVPIVAFGILCFGLMQITTSISTYLVDSVPGRGASATAAANFVRMVLAAILSITADPLIQAMGENYLSLFLALLNILSIAALFWVKVKGPELRKKSGF
ncbi:MFS general substrate transporter [Basidiobolus meristosporus CBS 931.73]|uniref:MFS general substrate transporter n=1 Tax=Basidiobolus meristosporus CBS 931.73 TaxID=1314790 RepID=A0A1Y1Z528_9FUNG|nr:MFS general substrate transporter [Basidiobolus meristosporus CBS 931.73]|eukprot:ORY05316.1 MFS general substrate transporter [Basidiobolus meristosporus CBS 931.73]